MLLFFTGNMPFFWLDSGRTLYIYIYLQKWHFVSKIIVSYCEKKYSSNRENQDIFVEQFIKQ